MLRVAGYMLQVDVCRVLYGCIRYWHNEVARHANNINMTNHQRKGAISNAHVGKEFENIAKKYISQLFLFKIYE
ncbi:MAG: hypothetical protein ABII90_11930 [Bacteroidota bacterium]